jgi:hypothetical protein
MEERQWRARIPEKFRDLVTTEKAFAYPNRAPRERTTLAVRQAHDGA